LPAGRALEANFTVVVTNNDSPGCPDTPYRIFPDFSMLPNPNYYYYHSAPYANAWHYDESILRVPANSTQSAAITRLCRQVGVGAAVSDQHRNCGRPHAALVVGGDVVRHCVPAAGCRVQYYVEPVHAGVQARAQRAAAVEQSVPEHVSVLLSVLVPRRARRCADRQNRH
jgi:hypothetical protein